MSVKASILRISDLEPYLLGNATVDNIQQDVKLMEKLVFGLILADVFLFLMFFIAICSVCCPDFFCRRRYARDNLPYTSVDINVPAKPPVGAPSSCGLQAP